MHKLLAVDKFCMFAVPATVFMIFFSFGLGLGAINYFEFNYVFRLLSDPALAQTLPSSTGLFHLLWAHSLGSIVRLTQLLPGLVPAYPCLAWSCFCLSPLSYLAFAKPWSCLSLLMLVPAVAPPSYCLNMSLVGPAL